MSKLKKSVYTAAVTTTYDWDYDATNVVLFKSYEDAKEHLRSSYEAEVANDVENGFCHEAYINDDGTYARIINYRGARGVDAVETASTVVDTTEWHLAGYVDIAGK